VSEVAATKRPLFLQALYEDIEIQLGRPIIPLESEFYDEEVKLTYMAEAARAESETLVRLPVHLRKSNHHFAGGLEEARESFKLEHVADQAVRGRMTKETRFSFAHLVLRFGPSSRAHSSSSVPPGTASPSTISQQQPQSQSRPSNDPFRSSLANSQRIEDRAAMPPPSQSSHPSSNASAQSGSSSILRNRVESFMRVKPEPGSPPLPMHPSQRERPPPSPPRRTGPIFPFNVKESYVDNILTQRNTDAFLSSFLDRFESQRSGGRLLDYYSQTASFSYTDIDGPSAVNGRSARSALRAYGQYPITNALKKVPVCTFAKADSGRIIYDATRVTHSSNPMAFLPLLVTLHGELTEVRQGYIQHWSVAHIANLLAAPSTVRDGSSEIV
jgi:hypothetical protein